MRKMYIHEAVKQAIEKEKFIEREAFENSTAYRKIKIKPTNSSATCMIYAFEKNGEEIHHCKDWNPTAEDLAADDWKLVD